MTELTMADLRKVFAIAILLTIVQWVVTSGDLHAIAPTLVGFIAIFAALFVVGLLFFFLQRQAPW
ncbi:hypothetical protein SAMN05421858_2603 [Haladaptatus litoreus]|uniref:Uncharacterized protein n=1 Tax=Haladaptatus litoreus TaxID=553468 RepID=A0A1N7BK58_9EURY|nr:hypothetical protein [Haladaptatus litoreus]SIR51710.1 hypothetical protein SAMN05421858_2603 [Haladaptatus litoreus]